MSLMAQFTCLYGSPNHNFHHLYTPGARHPDNPMARNAINQINMEIKDPAFNYDKYGHSYSGQRQTDPRIETYIYQALGQSATILNVGAGAGSYEPEDTYVV